MSLFDDFKGGQIIDKPRQLQNYRKVLKTKAEKEEEKDKKKEWKKLAKQKRAELSPEEFKKWNQKAYYEWFGEERKKYQNEYVERQRQEKEAMLEEIFSEVYDTLPEPIDYDKYYLDKFREDDIDVDGKYRFSWRSSKLIFENRKRMPQYTQPIRIYGRRGINATIKNLLKEEGRAYELLLPHLDELMGLTLRMKKKQTITKYPLWITPGKLGELVEKSDIAPSHICNVLSAIQRDKYIISEAYLGRTSFIMGDVVVTQTGGKFQPCLENNIPRLTKDTIEEIHETRMKWWKQKGKEKPPLYLVKDAYLVKIPINEWETYFYIIPT